MNSQEKYQNDYISPAGLHNEKSMWDLYKLSYKFPSSKSNIGLFIFSLLSLLFYCFWVNPDVVKVAENFRAVLGFGAALAPAIIGFLVAGFTIFVTITRVELFNFMATKRFGTTNESYLKYNMSAFMLAFIHYCAYILFCALLIVFAQPNGPLILMVKYVFDLQDPTAGAIYYLCFLKLLFSLFGAWSIYLILLLKSFVYNIYQVLCTTVRWAIEQEDAKKSESDSCCCAKVNHI